MPKKPVAKARKVAGARPLEKDVEAFNLANPKGTGCWQIMIPAWRPASVNELMKCVGARIRLKKNDRDLVVGYAAQCRIPPATAKRRISLHVLLGPKDREPDPDNLEKSLYDACKHAGLIVDDKQKFLERGPVLLSRGPCLRSIITVEDWPD